MRNLKKVLCLALVLSMVLAVVSGAAYYRNYTDVDDMTKLNEKYQLAAQYFNDLGIIVGVPTANPGEYEYQPNALLTRAEMARILYTAYSGIAADSLLNPGTAYESLPCTFKDIDTTWAVKEIKYGFNKGYLNGRNATTFAPNDNVTAQEFATALLAAIGYEKEDLAKAWPKNVILYGYDSNPNLNLFTTGLPNSAADTTLLGEQIAGILTGTTGNVDTEAELKLNADITRQEAIYMMFKAFENRTMVSKTYQGKAIDVYYNTGDTLMEVVWGAWIHVQPKVGYVYASEGNSYFGDATGVKGCVDIEYTEGGDQQRYMDIGMSYEPVAPYGDVLGFEVGFENWDEDIGKKVYFNEIYFYKNGSRVNSIPYMNGYDIDFNTYTVKGMEGGAKIKNVDVPMNSKVTFNGTEITINGASYGLFRGQAKVSTNGVAATMTNIADVAKEIGNGCAVGTDGLTADSLKLTVVNGNIAVATELEYAMFTVVSKVESPFIAANFGIASGFPDVTVKDSTGAIVTYQALAGAAFGPYLKAYSISGSYAAGSTLLGYIKTSGDLKATVVEPTKVENATIVMSGDKQYINSISAENELKIANTRAAGAASNVALAPAYTGTFVAGSEKYYDLTMINGFVYAATEKAKVKTVGDAVLKSKTRVVNTIDNKVTYTFVATADSKDFTYNYTWTVGGTEDTYWNPIAVNSKVTVKYDVKTLATVGDIGAPAV